MGLILHYTSPFDHHSSYEYKSGPNGHSKEYVLDSNRSEAHQLLIARLCHLLTQLLCKAWSSSNFKTLFAILDAIPIGGGGDTH